MDDEVDAAIAEVRDALSNHTNWRESWMAPIRVDFERIVKYVEDARKELVKLRAEVAIKNDQITELSKETTPSPFPVEDIET